MTRTVWGIQSITMQYLCMMTDDKTYPGDDFEKYRNTVSLCCVPGTNILLQVNYASKTNSQKKRSDLWLPEAGVGEEEVQGEKTG